MKYILFILLSFFLIGTTMAQNINPTLPYYEIPEYPNAYTGENVAARMVDGLGFRYYWATEGLSSKDLAFKPSEEARSTDQTLDHLYGLSKTILNAVKNIPNVRPAEAESLTFNEKRKRTLENIKAASDLLKSGVNLEESNVEFQSAGNTSTFPFWNMLNGPIADALWHCGQVVSFRRSTGNPLNPNVSMFSGKVRESK